MKPGDLMQIHYGKRYRSNCEKYQHRHCRVLRISNGRPHNVLVELKGGEKIVVPSGNLVAPNTYHRQTLIGG